MASVNITRFPQGWRRAPQTLTDHASLAKRIRTQFSLDLEPRPQAVIEKRKPRSCLAGCVSVKSYTTLASLLGLLLSADTMLRYATLTPLERRFGFSTSESGLLVAAYDVGHVLLLVVLSYAGSKVNKPRAVSLGGLLAVGSALVWAVPHLVYGSGSRTSEPTWNTSLPSSFNSRLCDRSNNSLVSCPSGDLQINSTSRVTEADDQLMKQVAFWVLCVSQCMLGASAAPILTVGVTYLDDNCDPQTSAAGVAIIISVGSLGLVAGFMIGALTANIHADIIPPALSSSSTDPGWISAWWLGSLIIAFFTLIASLPFFGFPRNMKLNSGEKENVQKKKPTTHELEETPYSEHTPMTEELRGRANSVEVLTSNEYKDRPKNYKREPSQISKPSIKSLPKTSKSIVSDTIYVASTLAMCALVYLPGGVFSFLPKYLELHFRISTVLACIISAIVSALALASGTFIGGLIVSLWQLTPRGSAKLISAGCFLSVLCFVGAMFISCKQVTIESYGSSPPGMILPNNSCNNGCGCSLEFNPVCGADKLTYFSPCHAGCSHGSTKMNYRNCSCLLGARLDASLLSTPGVADPDRQVAIPGACFRSCSTLIPYCVVMFFGTFFVALGNSPLISLVIRSVPEDYKSLSLGINNLATSILGSIPAPILYGLMIDTTCSVRQPITSKQCGSDGVSGSSTSPRTCLLYDTDSFRYLLHGVTAGCVTAALLFSLVALARLSCMHRKQTTNRKPSRLEFPPTEMRTLNDNNAHISYKNNAPLSVESDLLPRNDYSKRENQLQQQPNNTPV